MSKEAEINFIIKLDDDNGPEEIYWGASEADFEGLKPCESLMISMWDQVEKNTMSIDLWTKEMEVGEMSTHFYFTFMKMADTFEKATNKKELSDMIRHFATQFASKVEELANE
ncbi:MAG: gliding motility protein GldC [Candidatus Dadabacteria bacterium]|jgi:gliding motility-associated protein GldC|nr:gliding motility protein GldC [Candidatus Dadabacteria bacterium]MCZ6685808.1 gliding motility protein GldC [Candidatus Dadabacteria bacterium]